MFNPIITEQLRILGRDVFTSDLEFEEKLETLYQDSQGASRKPIYYDGSITESEFREGEHFAEFIQQWKILAEKIKTWMSTKGISLSRSTPGDSPNARLLNQDQILDRFIHALEDPQGTHIQSTPHLGNSGKKALEKAVLILGNTEKPVNVRTGKSAVTELLEGILMCAPRCFNAIESFFESLDQKHQQKIELALLQHKTELLKTILLTPLTPSYSSPFHVIAKEMASLLHPHNEEMRNNEFLALQDGDQIHVMCLIQQALSELPEDKKFITQFDPNDYFKNTLLSRIQRMGGEEYLQTLALDLTELIAARYHPIVIVKKIAQDLVEEIGNFFPTDEMMEYEEAKKALGPWKEKIIFEEMYALYEKNGKIYLNALRLYQELSSSIAEELFHRGFFDRAFTEMGSDHFYVNGHLELSWVSRALTQEGREIVIQKDSSIRVTPSEMKENFWIIPQKYAEEKLPLVPDHWESSFSSATERTQAFEILVKDPVSIRNILLEMRVLGATQKHFIYIANLLQAKHVHRDVITLLWYELFSRGDAIAKEKIKHLISAKIGPSSIVESLKNSPSIFLRYSEDPFIRESSLHIEHLIHYLYSIGWKDFSSIRASKQNFRDFTLSGSIFNDAMLSESSFAKCDLTDVSFRGAKLNHVKFIASSILQDVDFSSADLRNANFQQLSLAKANHLETANLEGVEFHSVEFSAAQIQQKPIRDALCAQTRRIIQKPDSTIHSSEELLFWLKIYEELSQDNRDLIVRALTAESTDRICFLFRIFQKLPLSQAKQLLNVVKLILVQENPEYLHHASTIFETTDERGDPLLHHLIKIQAFPLFVEFLSVIREIMEIQPSLVTTILSKNKKNPLLHFVLSTRQEDAIGLLLDITAQLPLEDQIALCSLTDGRGNTLLYEAVRLKQTNAVSKLCSMISPLLKKDPSLFAQLTLVQDPIFKLTPLEEAVFLKDPQMVADLLDLYDQSYSHDAQQVLSGIFFEKEPQYPNASPFQESFLVDVSQSPTHKMIIDRFFKTLKRMKDPSIFDRYIPSQLPLLALTMKYLQDEHLIILLIILKNHPNPRKALELLYFRDEHNNQLFDQLLQSSNLRIRIMARKIESHFQSVLRQTPVPICSTKNPRHTRSALPCDRDSLLQEAEEIEGYHVDSTWDLRERELGFLLDFIGKENPLAKIPMKEWSQQITQAQRDRMIDLHQRIHQAKQQTPILSQKLEALLTEAEPKTLWIHHKGHSFFLSIDSSSRRTPYTLHDLWLFKDAKVFLNPQETLRALSDLYQIDSSSTQYQVYDLDALDPNGDWKKKTKEVLETIFPPRDEFKKSALCDFFSLQGKTIPPDHAFPIDPKSPLIKDLWFRPKDFLHFHSRIPQKELLNLQAILKEQKRLYPSPSLDIEIPVGSKRNQRKVETYWKEFVNALIAIPESDFSSSSISHYLSKFQIDSLLKTDHFRLSDMQYKALSERSHKSLLELMEKTSSHARTALPWLQTLLDVSHGQFSGAAMLIGTETYTRFVAPRLQNWLTKNSYLKNLFGNSFSHSLGKAISAGPGVLVGLIPVGDGIAKMSKYPPGSIEFKEGSLELGTGIGFFLTSLIPSPIGLFADLILIGISTFEGGELAIERLEHESYIILEKTFLNRFLMELGITPMQFEKAINQAELEMRSGQFATDLFSQLEAHYQNASAQNHPQRIPVMIYSWPQYERENLFSFRKKSNFDALRKKYPDLIKQHLAKMFVPGRGLSSYILQIEINPPLPFLSITENEVSIIKKTFIKEFSASIDQEKFQYLYGPHENTTLPADSSNTRSFPKIFEGNNQTAAFTFKEIPLNNSLLPIDHIFPHIDHVTRAGSFQGRANDTLTILSSFSLFPEPFYRVPLAKFLQGHRFSNHTLFRVQGYGQYTFKSLEKTDSFFEFQLIDIKHFALDLHNMRASTSLTTYTINENQIHFDQKPFISWTGCSTKSFSFFGPPDIPGVITLPQSIPTQINLPALPLGSIHRIQSVHVNQREPCIIRLDGPNANVYLQFVGGNAFNFTYQGEKGPRVLLTWQQKENSTTPILQFEGELNDIHPSSIDSVSSSNQTGIEYSIYRIDPLLLVKVYLQGIKEAEVLTNYRGYPVQLTLLGASKQSLLSITIPDEHFVLKAKELHSELLTLCHIYYIWNQSYTHVSIGAAHPSLLPGALFRLQGKGEQYPEIHLNHVNHETHLLMLPNLADRIILHVEPSPWISLQVSAINRVSREGHTLHLSEGTKPFHRGRHRGRTTQKPHREPLVGEKVPMTLSIPHYFPKAPPLYINEILYEVTENEARNFTCLRATLSIFDPPLHEINQQTLIAACCEIAVAENALSSEQNFFSKGNLHVGPISLNIRNLSDTLKVILAEEEWSLPQLRALQGKRMLAQKREYDTLFATASSKSQNRTKRTLPSISSSGTRVKTLFSWISDFVAQYIPFSKEGPSHKTPSLPTDFSSSNWNLSDTLQLVDYGVRSFLHYWKNPVLTVEEYLIYYCGNEYFKKAPPIAIPFPLIELIQKECFLKETNWQEIRLLLKELNDRLPDDLAKELKTKIETFPLLTGTALTNWMTTTNFCLRSKRNYQKIKHHHQQLSAMKKGWQEQNAFYGKKNQSAFHASEWAQLGDTIEDALDNLRRGKIHFETDMPLSIEFFKQLPTKKEIRSYDKLQMNLLQR